LLIFGMDEPGYTASKLFPYVLARKPLLTIFHTDSSVTTLMHRLAAGVAVSFGEADAYKDISGRVFEQWFSRRGFETAPDTRWEDFEEYTAEAMADRVTDIFDQVAGQSRP
jgi:hypothetical protein